MDDFYECLQSLNYSNFIVLGDFNIDLSNIHHAKLSKVLQTFCLTQVVNGSTHVAPLGKESILTPHLYPLQIKLQL